MSASDSFGGRSLEWGRKNKIYVREQEPARLSGNGTDTNNPSVLVPAATAGKFNNHPYYKSSWYDI